MFWGARMVYYLFTPGAREAGKGRLWHFYRQLGEVGSDTDGDEERSGFWKGNPEIMFSIFLIPISPVSLTLILEILTKTGGSISSQPYIYRLILGQVISTNGSSHPLCVVLTRFTLRG